MVKYSVKSIIVMSTLWKSPWMLNCVLNFSEVIFCCNFDIFSGRRSIPVEDILSITFLSNGFIILPPSLMPSSKSSIVNTIKTPSSSISWLTLKAIKLPLLLFPIKLSHSTPETSILFVVEPIMFWRESLLISVTVLLHETKKRDMIIKNLNDFTRPF